jgi:O-antigen ligase
LNEGDSAGRDLIVKKTLSMISERPILGWGPNAYQFELRWRETGINDLQSPQDPHNLELNALIEVGVLGTIPFVLGIVSCCVSAWKNRREGLGILPFALIIALLVLLQFDTFVTAKPLWFALALGAATTGYAARPLDRPRSI